MLASGLSVEKPGSTPLGEYKQPMFYGQEMVDFYKLQAVNIFKRNLYGAATVILIWSLIFAFFGATFLYIGHIKYANPKKIKA